ncbi:hypothetical protein D3C76_1446970 [compost metagenome]
MPSTAASMSASSKMITGALPPSSMCMRLTLSAVLEMMFEPVAIEPVSDTMRTFGWVTSGLPTVGPRPNTRLSTPAGKISDASSARRRAVSGVCSDGLSTTVLPAARAGAIFQATIISG